MAGHAIKRVKGKKQTRGSYLEMDRGYDKKIVFRIYKKLLIINNKNIDSIIEKVGHTPHIVANLIINLTGLRSIYDIKKPHCWVSL
jgi:hypothetical protein